MFPLFRDGDSIWTPFARLAIWIALILPFVAMRHLLRFAYGWMRPSFMAAFLTHLRSELTLASWTRWYRLERLVAGICACLCYMALSLAIGTALSSPAHPLLACFYLLVGLVLGFPYQAWRWIADYCASPDFQKKLAGLRAEAAVARMIDEALPADGSTRALHGCLFVFHPGEEREFSVEVDHLLISSRHVYLVETKYKSGTIHAAADADTWRVVSPWGESRMRNALAQAKRAARVLEREWALPVEIVPLVAIEGQDVDLVGAPANVVPAIRLIETINAFEEAFTGQPLDTEWIARQCLAYASCSREVRERHVARAEQARVREQSRHIVQTASLR